MPKLFGGDDHGVPVFDQNPSRENVNRIYKGRPVTFFQTGGTYGGDYFNFVDDETGKVYKTHEFSLREIMQLPSSDRKYLKDYLRTPKYYLSDDKDHIFKYRLESQTMGIKEIVGYLRNGTKGFFSTSDTKYKCYKTPKSYGVLYNVDEYLKDIKNKIPIDVEFLKASGYTDSSNEQINCRVSERSLKGGYRRALKRKSRSLSRYLSPKSRLMRR